LFLRVAPYFIDARFFGAVGGGDVEAQGGGGEGRVLVAAQPLVVARVLAQAGPVRGAGGAVEQFVVADGLGLRGADDGGVDAVLLREGMLKSVLT
jgi:hypothetical protein